MKYYQCTLSQGRSRTTAYIEERAAKIGKYVEIKEDGFTGLWKVDHVANRGVEENMLKLKQKMDRNAFSSIK